MFIHCGASRKLSLQAVNRFSPLGGEQARASYKRSPRAVLMLAGIGIKISSSVSIVVCACMAMRGASIYV